MELLILGYVIGEFYFQTNELEKRKRKSIKHVLMHGMIYTVAMSIPLILLVTEIDAGVRVSMVIFISHIGLEALIGAMESKYSKYKCQFFLISQILYIMILFGINYIFIKSNSVQYNFLTRNNILILILVLVCWKPAATVVNLVLKQLTPFQDADNESRDEVERMGFWIGVLEREIILILGVFGQYGAIGFVLTAKSIARYKQLEDKKFAEKYLIGTLLSALISVVGIMIYEVYKS